MNTNFVTKVYKVYGRDGHRQAISFCNSFEQEVNRGTFTRSVKCDCADKTGTNDYVVVTITAETDSACDSELWGQISDGIFENARTGKIERIA